MPCVISASTLFCVDTRGVESRRPLPLVSSADSATSRLNAPFTEPSARPTALVAPPHAQVDSGRLCRPAGPCVAAGAPAKAAAVRKREVRRVAERRIDAAVEAPLDAELPREVLVRLDDARLDLDLRLRLVERVDQVGGGLQPIGEIA